MLSAFPLTSHPVPEHGGRGREAHGGAEFCSECGQRGSLGPAHVRTASVEQRASSSSKLQLLCQKKEAQRTRSNFAGSLTLKGE